jgi:hypothetical protein
MWAPTVSWSTIRMMMVLAAQMQLHTRAINISSAFACTPMPPEYPVYVELPRDFEEEGKVFRLKRSLYGLRAAPKLWFDYLRANLVDKLGFQNSSNDVCLFHKPGIVVLVYVDDILFFSKSNEAISKEISALEKTFKITKDDEDQDVFA